MGDGALGRIDRGGLCSWRQRDSNVPYFPSICHYSQTRPICPNLRPLCLCFDAVQLLTPRDTHRKDVMMTILFGREYSRRELLDRVGDMSQLAGTRKTELVEIREMNYFHEQLPLLWNSLLRRSAPALPSET